jgi:NADPH:quinone reductase-like Zn-dependent oxidoreductase
MTAEALWCVAPDRVEIRPGQIGEGVLVEALFSGISRGTERLVAAGRVPASEYSRMRGPGMEGDFPYPVKYGYCSVGRVVEGPLKGRAVFALFPHQTLYRLPETALTPLPDQLPPERAVLAANMETALTILWDSGAGAGDRIAVIGAGVVGALVASLAARLPGTEVTLVDINPDRAALAQTLGVDFALPDAAPQDCDVIIHTSASESGLTLALSLAGQEGTVVEASWHGDGPVSVPLGGAFHSRRLRLISSQVGNIPAQRLPRWSYGRRLAKALDLLCDDRLNVLISGETDFADLPGSYAGILAAPGTLCHRIRY